MRFRPLIQLIPVNRLHECVCSWAQWASSGLANHSVHSGKTFSGWIFSWRPHFINVLAAGEKQNRPPTERNRSAYKSLLLARIRLQIYKTAAAADIKAPLKFLCHDDLSSRTDTETALPQNKEASCSPLAIDPPASVTCRHNVEHFFLTKWQREL